MNNKESVETGEFIDIHISITHSAVPVKISNRTTIGQKVHQIGFEPSTQASL